MVKARSLGIMGDTTTFPQERVVSRQALLLLEGRMIYLYLNETERLAEIVAALVKLKMGVVAELHGDRWHIEVTV